MKKIIFTILLIIAAIGIFQIFTSNKPTPQTTSPKPQIYASFYPLYFFTTQLAGEKTDIYSIVPSGIEPHDYEPNPQTLAKLESSNLLILNGGEIELWAEKLIPDLEAKNVQVIITAENIMSKEIKEEDKLIKDPHVWLSPKLASEQVSSITEALIKVDPLNKPIYLQNQQKLQSKLTDLDQKFINGLKNCSQKEFVTSHAAFAYLADDYGLTQVPIAGLSPEEEPSIQQLTQLTDLIKAKEIKYIFFETLVSPELSETIARETNVQTLVLDPLEGISDDDIKAGKNYFTVMEQNLVNLQKALECRQ